MLLLQGWVWRCGKALRSRGVEEMLMLEELLKVDTGLTR